RRLDARFQRPGSHRSRIMAVRTGSDSDAYVTPVNTLGQRLLPPGDFSLIASISPRSGSGIVTAERWRITEAILVAANNWIALRGGTPWSALISISVTKGFSLSSSIKMNASVG